jgi:hypothetical protein
VGLFKKFIENTKAALDPRVAIDPRRKEVNDPLNLMHADELPDVAAAPVAPTGADPAIAEAQRLEREAQLRARGRASTIATSGEGDTSRPSLARRVLLGA